MVLPKLLPLLLIWHVNVVIEGKMSGNVPTINSRKLKCTQLLNVKKHTTLANCADSCVYETDCKAFSFNRRRRFCELYLKDSRTADVEDVIEDDDFVFIDIENWPHKRTGACLNKPCGEHSVCVPDKESKHCLTSCPSGWVPKYGKCFHFLPTTKMKYDQAEAYCKERGAKLAEPLTQTDDAILKCMVLQYGGKNWWLGLNDREVEGRWVLTSNGKRASYLGFIWNRGNGGDVYSCAAYWYNEPGTPDHPGHRWEDIPCAHEHNVICEMI